MVRQAERQRHSRTGLTLRQPSENGCRQIQFQLRCRAELRFAMNSTSKADGGALAARTSR